jgi:hypothetical protein
MYTSLFTTIVGTAIALLLTVRERQRRLGGLVWWLVPVAISVLPPLALVGVEWVASGEVSRSLRYALWGGGFVATLSVLFVTYGRAGDGRVVRWGAPLVALLGIAAVGALEPQIGALIAPVTVFAVVARALPRAKSVAPRRRIVASLGLIASACVAVAFALSNPMGVFGLAIFLMAVAIAVSLIVVGD